MIGASWGDVRMVVGWSCCRGCGQDVTAIMNRDIDINATPHRRERKVAAMKQKKSLARGIYTLSIHAYVCTPQSLIAPWHTLASPTPNTTNARIRHRQPYACYTLA